jgi:putative peptide zinc metalloprotease protein
MVSTAFAWPALRDELRLHHGPAQADGQPTWTLQDPVRHRFLRIDWLTYEILRRWWLGDAERIAEQVNQQTTLAIGPGHVQQVLGFAQREQLVLPAGPAAGAAHEGSRSLMDAARWLLHHYLFFRVPLAQPQRGLQRLLPLAAWLGSAGFTAATLAALLLGLAGVLRQWDSVGAQWLDLLSWRGLALYGATLVVVKLAHELGHALVAVHHGLRVPTMGVAFMVLWPVAYTDTTEAWRLADRHARMRIAAAGVRTELTLAAWATLAWVLLPDGGLRTACFVVASMTWITSLLVNLSPFMRFDGYFLLCDALEMPNLHERSFALARWQLRRLVLGWHDEPPEPQPPARRAALIAFAYVTWAYRLALYLGIAWMVYHFAFKLLGLLLFAVELGWFVLAPLARELRLWWRARARWRGGRSAWVSGAVLAVLAGLAAVPWPVRETAGAVLQPAVQLDLHLPAAATVQAVHVRAGQAVAAGALLVSAAAPAIQRQLSSAQLRIQDLERQVATASLGAEQQAQWRSAQAALATARHQAHAVEEELARYQPRAPFAGVVVELDPSLRPGAVAAPRQSLLRLVAPGAWRVVAYVSEPAARSLAAGDAAAFTADALPLQRWPARVLSVAPHPSSLLAEPVLAQAHGGLVDAQESGGRWRPVQVLYRVELQLDQPPPLALRQWRGHVVLSLPGRSWWERGWSAAAEVLVREGGF